MSKEFHIVNETKIVANIIKVFYCYPKLPQYCTLQGNFTGLQYEVSQAYLHIILMAKFKNMASVYGCAYEGEN